MKTAFPLLIATLACMVCQVASAVPVHATFSGNVAGATGLSAEVLNDFPVGAAATFDVTFDDAGLVDALPVSDFDLAPVSGWLRLGSLEWLFDAGRIGSYSYLNTPGAPVVWYGLQLTGTGPTIGGNASIFGLFLTLTPDLEQYAGSVLRAGFAYPVPNGEYYSYANLAGTFTTSRQGTSVPEPNAALLTCSAFVLLAFLRRSRRSNARAAQLTDSGLCTDHELAARVRCGRSCFARYRTNPSAVGARLLTAESTISVNLRSPSNQGVASQDPTPAGFD
jgi:hypothetical protein